jgi:hypothetical protein
LGLHFRIFHPAQAVPRKDESNGEVATAEEPTTTRKTVRDWKQTSQSCRHGWLQPSHLPCEVRQVPPLGPSVCRQIFLAQASLLSGTKSYLISCGFRGAGHSRKGDERMVPLAAKLQLAPMNLFILQSTILLCWSEHCDKMQVETERWMIALRLYNEESLLNP